jgi:SAM-dependent methyltransferase
MDEQANAAAAGTKAKRPPERPPVGDVFCPFPERLAQIEREKPMSERTRANVSRALDLIDPTEREAFLDKYRDRLQTFDDFSLAKYADFAYWAFRNVVRAEWLGLDRSEPLDILDIGMGPGSFGMVAKSMGHRVVGTDLDKPWYRDFDRIAGVERIIAPVRRGEPYRPTDRKFDLISIMLPNFHRKVVDGRIEYWTMEDWRLFLDNLVSDLLKPGGRIYLAMPPDRLHDGTVQPSALLGWSEERGANVEKTADGRFTGQILFESTGAETFADRQSESVAR